MGGYEKGGVCEERASVIDAVVGGQRSYGRRSPIVSCDVRLTYRRRWRHTNVDEATHTLDIVLAVGIV